MANIRFLSLTSGAQQHSNAPNRKNSTAVDVFRANPAPFRISGCGMAVSAQVGIYSNNVLYGFVYCLLLTNFAYNNYRSCV